jgi:predicted O-methyltransferase YrrM
MILNISNTDKEKMIIISRPAISFCKSYLCKNPIGVEVGVFYGLHAIQIMNLLNPSILYLVDPYNYSNTSPENNITSNQEAFNSVKKNVKEYPNVRFILQPSVLAADMFPDKYFDFVYIDAEHTYKAVKEDVEAWLPKVRYNGVIAGHDFGMEEVKKAIREVTIRSNSPEINIYGNFYHFGDDWWFINNKYFKYNHLG